MDTGSCEDMTDKAWSGSQDGSHNVPKEYLRTLDHQLLPPRVGHNWNDQAFRKCQDKPQQLEAEFRGKRYFTSVGNFDNPLPDDMCDSAQQLLLALMQRKDRSKRGGATDAGRGKYVTLDDKVLRFYAFFNEPAPDGGANEFWHRRVVIMFYPSDDTIAVHEPHIPNSGLDGGAFLKRQKVKTDARQREQFPGEEVVSLNFFNVGQSVRLNAVDFYLYDCDAFTRQFLTLLGVDVGEPTECPDDEFMHSYKINQLKMESAKFGLLSQDAQGDEAERAARFVRDGGKILRFYGLLNERGKVEGGVVRRLEVLMYVEDNTITVVERQGTSEAVPSLFLSRTWLPKCGSVAKLNELTFKHRINGQREPFMGNNAYYKENDLDVGMTMNVLGRDVLLYDCDEYTREFFAKRYGRQLASAVDVSELMKPTPAASNIFAASNTQARSAKQPSNSRGDVSATTSSKAAPAAALKDVLRFRMVLANPKNHTDAHRQFALAFYTDTCKAAAYEIETRNSGRPTGCILKHQRLPKPLPPRGPRNAPGQKEMDAASSNGAGASIFGGGGDRDYYKESDLFIGSQIVVAGMLMNLTAMDDHTDAYLSGTIINTTSESETARLLEALLEFLWSRYGTAVKAFLAFDHDKDGVISLQEFTVSLRSFQITEDEAAAATLFHRIASSADTAYLTTEDIMKWMGSEKNMGTLQAKSTVTGEKAQEEFLRLRALRTKTLLELRERLAARCMNYASMFRLASTMPRAYRGRRADIHCFTNPKRDAIITPVQLRRCIEEILGALPTEEEMACVLHFFFPTMPVEQYLRRRDEMPDYTVDLPEFQKRYHEMYELTMLPDKALLNTTTGSATADVAANATTASFDVAENATLVQSV